MSEDEEEKKLYDDDSMDIKDDLKYLEQKLNDFTLSYNQQKLHEMYDKAPDSLMVEDEITSLDLKLRSFGKYLIDTKLYIQTLTHPDINKYKEWDLKKMIQWISSLENGRFRAYLDILRAGFESDGIQNGILLPELDVNVLRNDPFNIKNFKDRKDLETHFKSLKSQQTNNDDNSNTITMYDAEGTVTEHHL